MKTDPMPNRPATPAPWSLTPLLGAVLPAAVLLTALLLTAACAPPAGDGTPASDAPAEAPPATDGAAEAALEDADQRFAAAFAGPIEATHGAEAWYGKDAVAADVAIEFGGNRVFAGDMLFTPTMEKARVDLPGTGDATGASVVWDGGTAWVSPADAEFPRARFHVLTWPYFLAAPMKLRDPGTRLEDLGSRTMEGRTYDVARLSFEGAVGDTPDDWYVLYRDGETNRLAAMAYIVTYGTPREDAEAEPHAITYEDFTTVDGVEIPTTWRFWLWNEEDGIHGDPIGRVELSEVRFMTPGPEAFEVPEDAREEALPEVGAG